MTSGHRPPSAPSWRLSGLYKSPKDRRLEKSIAGAVESAQKFEKRYKDRVSKLRGEKPFLKALRNYESILTLSSKPLHYASLRHAEKTTEYGRGAFLQKMREQEQVIKNMILFFPLELQALSAPRLKRLIQSSALQSYRHYLELLLQKKSHRLTEVEEKLYGEKAMTGRLALIRLYHEEFARKHFHIRHNRKSKVCTQSEATSLLYHPNRSVRRHAAEALSEGIEELEPRIGYLYNMLIQDKYLEDLRRRYKYPEQSRHLLNEIGDEVVDAMVGSVISQHRLVQRYYSLKRSLLGVSRLYDYDRYAPVVSKRGNVRYSFSESRTLILRAFAHFSPEMSTIAEEFFRKRWIDAAARPGKKGGAFCDFVTPDHHPYILTNYHGHLQDIFTLAHELGHGVHAYLMRSQSYLHFDIPLTLAETASVFSELLLFHHLKKITKEREELITLYCGTIESIIATVFRQISIYRFEQDAHRIRRQEGELSVQRFHHLWRLHQKRMFGTSVTLSPHYEHWWCAIPHMFHTPFYVYSYAFGELLALSLYGHFQQAHAENLGKKFSDRYLKLLRAGGSASPQELLKPFGVVLSDRMFWDSGLMMIRRMIDELQALVRKR